MKPLFVTGIGTGIGKTLVSAILVQKLGADYWKPVQSGDLDHSDTTTVRGLVNQSLSVFHPESFRLTRPFSPHKSAALDGIEIRLDDIVVPTTKNCLVIEGAGGLMVPLNKKELILHLIQKVDAEVVLVSRNYLGSINHTLLTATVLNMHSIPVRGIIFNGESEDWSEKYILEHTGYALLGRIPELDHIDVIKLTELINI